jgi:tetratricopeptide (TPR) repeat protein
MRRILLSLFIFISFTGYSQDILDKNVYLVDSLDYEKISPENQFLLNSYIQYYHDSDDEMYKISVINEIVRNCFDINIWTRYNKVVAQMADEKLSGDLSDSLRTIYKTFKAGTVYYEAWEHYYKTEYDLSIADFKRSRDLYKATGSTAGVASSIDNIGSVYSTKGEMAKALEFHVEALKMREELQDTLGLGASYNAIGIIHMMHGDYNKAIADFEKAIGFHTHVQWWSGLSNEYSNLGNLETKLGHNDKALEYHLESYRIKDILKDKQGMCISLTNIAASSLLNGDTITAIEYQNYALQISEETGDQRSIAGSLNSLGFIHLLKDEYEEGFEKIEKALAISTEVGSQIDRRQSLTHLLKGCIWKGEPEKAEPYLQELVQMRIVDIKANFAILSEQDKALYFKTMVEEYDNLYAYGYLTYESNPAITKTLYDNTLMLKGLLLKSSTAMRQAILESGDDKLMIQYEEWIAFKVNIADGYARGLSTDSLEQTANIIEAELVTKSSAFDDFYAGKEANWEDVKLSLDKTEAAIEFIRYPKDILYPDSEIIYAALLINSDSKQPKLVNLCTEEDLEKVLGKINYTAGQIHPKMNWLNYYGTL